MGYSGTILFPGHHTGNLGTTIKYICIHEETKSILNLKNACSHSVQNLGEEHRLRVSGNRMLRKIFGPKRKEAVGNWRRLDDEELHNVPFTKYC
jgi:hypothetical protein